MRYIKYQKGVTLIELMVGIAIGLMVIATALGALMISRSIAGSTNELTSLQQQASLIGRNISQQIRQAGALQLDISHGSTDKANPGIFDNAAVITTNLSGSTAPPSIQQSSTNTTTTLDTRLLAYTERLYASGTNTLTTGMQFANCLGENNNTNTMLQSRFTISAANVTTGMRTLFCAGTSGTPQPIASNILDFRLNYVYQLDANAGTPNYQILSEQQINAIAAPNNRERWSNVVAVNVCMVLVGSERVDTVGATYIGCDGTSSTSMNNRLTQVFRNTYEIRSQGAPV